MTSLRPFLIRAVIDWVVDNDCTPYVALAADAAGLEAPAQHAQNGRIVLNLSATATRNLHIDDEALHVDCRFRGRPYHIRAPLDAVLAVYAHETGQGLSFDSLRDDKPTKKRRPPSGRPTLEVVK